MATRGEPRVSSLYYALGVVIWASQTNLDNEPLHTYLTVLMFLGIAVHLLLGARYATRRRAA